MALALIVDEMMEEDASTTVVWSNDGSEMSGVRKCVVQSLIINGVKRDLPTFGIFIETRKSLSEQIKDIAKILSIASSKKYSEKDILQKVSFLMTDSSARNLQVIEKAYEDYEIEDVPATILCNIHPLMVLPEKIKSSCQMVHDTLGNDKISSCFMVDV